MEIDKDWLVIGFIILCFIGVAVRTRDEHGKKKEE